MPNAKTSLVKHLFEDGETHVYAVLDGASIPDLRQELYQLEPEYECLYRGELAADMAEMAPYLVRTLPEEPFTDWVLDRGWGNHWGIFLATTSIAPAVKRHLRKFLVVHDPDGRPLYFRFYDPRVLRVFLPTCTPEELTDLFGPVQWFAMEAESPNELLLFDMDNGALRQRKVEVEFEE